MHRKQTEVSLDSFIWSENDKLILSIIPYTETMSFGELCNALRNVSLCPMKGDKQGWRELFQLLNKFASFNYVSAVKEDGNIQTLQLTEEGAAFVRTYSDRMKPLIEMAEGGDAEEEYTGEW